MSRELWIVFGWPYGIVTGNLIASAIWAPLAVGTLWVFRNPVGRRYAAWHHKHLTAHIEALKQQEKEAASGRRHVHP